MKPKNTSNNNPIILWFLKDFISNSLFFKAEYDFEFCGIWPLAIKVNAWFALSIIFGSSGSLFKTSADSFKVSVKLEIGSLVSLSQFWKNG